MSLIAFSQSRRILLTAKRRSYKAFMVADSNSVDGICKMVCYHKIEQGKIRMIGDILDDLRGVLVLEEHPQKLYIWHFGSNTVIKNFQFNDKIFDAKMSRDQIVIVFRENIYVQYITGESKDIYKVGRKVKGLRDFWGAFVYTPHNSYLAVPKAKRPTSKQLVDVIVTDTKTNEVLTILKNVVKSSIVAMAFSRSGNMLAIASQNGLKIRIYNARTQDLLHQCCRSQPIPIQFFKPPPIVSIFFSECDSYIIATSETDSVLIYHLNLEPGYYGTRKVINLPGSADGSESICGIKAIGKHVRVLIASPPDYLFAQYIPNFDGNPNIKEKLYRLEKETRDTADICLGYAVYFEDTATGAAGCKAVSSPDNTVADFSVDDLICPSYETAVGSSYKTGGSSSDATLLVRPSFDTITCFSDDFVAFPSYHAACSSDDSIGVHFDANTTDISMDFIDEHFDTADGISIEAVTCSLVKLSDEFAACSLNNSNSKVQTAV